MKKIKTETVSHLFLIGAHRYTSRGGTARTAGGVLLTADVCLRHSYIRVERQITFYSMLSATS